MGQPFLILRAAEVAFREFIMVIYNIHLCKLVRNLKLIY